MFQTPVIALVSLFKQFAFAGVYLVSPVVMLAHCEPILTQYTVSASFHTSAGAGFSGSSVGSNRAK
jgi:hypothetical protein